MKASLFPAITRVASVVLLLVSAAAVGAQLKVMSAVGVQEMMEGLGPKFERESGHKLTIVFATLGPALKRIEGGETADVIVLRSGNRQFGEGREGSGRRRQKRGEISGWRRGAQRHA
jgi:ABC-type molybdate transport system substrate-binding protein